MKQYYVYILTNQMHTVLYVGMTNNVARRVWEHREGVVKGFTDSYNLHKLVYIETHQDVRIALEREKRIKRWKRSWKEDLIAENNPDWLDLYLKLNH